MLGGLSAAQFMRDHWQKKPLLVRQAFPGLQPPVTIAALKKLSRQDDVQSRLIWRDANQWTMKTGPLNRLPNKHKPDWTLLIQSVDLYDDRAAELLYRFNFIPSARLDDLMISIASQGGGVGPHFDSYDVFLIQAQGRRRWRFGQQKDLSLVPNLPLKILSRFQPEHDVVLKPGDMLYLPPNTAHDGVALDDDCVTLSVGFRAPTGAMMAQRLLEAALDSVRRVSFRPSLAIDCLGSWLTEPNEMARFQSSDQCLEPLTPLTSLTPMTTTGQLRLDRRTRLLYYKRRLFINGQPEIIPATALFKRVANERVASLTPQTHARLSADSQDTLADWLVAGWIHWHPMP